MNKYEKHTWLIFFDHFSFDDVLYFHPIDRLSSSLDWSFDAFDIDHVLWPIDVYPTVQNNKDQISNIVAYRFLTRTGDSLMKIGPSFCRSTVGVRTLSWNSGGRFSLDICIRRSFGRAFVAAGAVRFVFSDRPEFGRPMYSTWTDARP